MEGVRAVMGWGEKGVVWIKISACEGDMRIGMHRVLCLL